MFLGCHCLLLLFSSFGSLFFVVLFGVFCFFFFQAEDGIRDRTVTGVQTCALPISRFPQYDYDDMVEGHHRLLIDGLHVNHLRLILGTSMGCMHSFVWGETFPDFMRSEERRVGKECRSRWAGE